MRRTETSGVPARYARLTFGPLRGLLVALLVLMSAGEGQSKSSAPCESLESELNSTVVAVTILVNSTTVPSQSFAVETLLEAAFAEIDAARGEYQRFPCLSHERVRTAIEQLRELVALINPWTQDDADVLRSIQAIAERGHTETAYSLMSEWRSWGNGARMHEQFQAYFGELIRQLHGQ